MPGRLEAYLKVPRSRQHDNTQHNGKQYNNTQHNDKQFNNAQHENTQHHKKA
jgi:hypothetical protein